MLLKALALRGTSLFLQRVFIEDLLCVGTFLSAGNTAVKSFCPHDVLAGEGQTVNHAVGE